MKTRRPQDRKQHQYEQLSLDLAPPVLVSVSREEAHAVVDAIFEQVDFLEELLANVT